MEAVRWKISNQLVSIRIEMQRRDWLHCGSTHAYVYTHKSHSLLILLHVDSSSSSSCENWSETCCSNYVENKDGEGEGKVVNGHEERIKLEGWVCKGEDWIQLFFIISESYVNNRFFCIQSQYAFSSSSSSSSGESLWGNASTFSLTASNGRTSHMKCKAVMQSLHICER